MEEKETFKTNNPVNDTIIRQTSKSSIYLTADFFKNEMNEDPKGESYPV